jgi:uncharacterized membrane protein
MAAASALTGYPLGPIRYGTALGMKLGSVPWGAPLLWFVVVIGARSAALRALPKAAHAWVAVAVGALAMLTDFNLEPTAAKLRGFWFWLSNSPSQPPVFDPPAMNYGAWFVFGAVFAWMLRERRVIADPRSRSWKPAIVFGLFNAVFLLARVGRSLRG